MSSPGADQSGIPQASVVLADILSVPLSVDVVRCAVSDRRAGALALFVGAVRDHDAGRPVALLEYTCHPSAHEALLLLAHRYAGAGPAVRIGVAHRVGTLAVGDLAVVAAVAAEHRADAFEVCRALVDELKATVPIWKRQVFTDGTEEWVGMP